jgi:hypothetical protein
LINYDFDGAWPTMIDDFVVWARVRIRENWLNTQLSIFSHFYFKKIFFFLK